MAPVRMRCVLRRTTRIAGYALPILMLLSVAPTAAFSESLVCQSIRRGESAPQVARRLTGDSRNAYQTWFQIRNASSRFVPKSQYNAIRAGWQACLLKPIVQRASAKVDDVVASQRTRRIPGDGVRDLRGAASVRSRRPAGRACDPCGGRSKPGSAVARARDRVRDHACDRGARLHDAVALRCGGCAVARVADRRRLSRSQEDGIHRRAAFRDRFVDEFERPLGWSDVGSVP